MSKSIILLSLTLPVILLAGCMADKDVVIQPDKEPSEVAKSTFKEKTKELSITEVSDFYSVDKSLSDYKDELAEMGYVKPYKEIILAESDMILKKGLIYKVTDGFAMIEYDVDRDEVMAITGYQNEQEIALQEMKTKAFAKENEQIAEKDEKKKALLKLEVAEMWEEIGEIESVN